MNENGQRLPLDLTHPFHRLLLRTRLRGARRLELREAAAPQDLAWLGRAHELLLPLSLPEPDGSSPLPTPPPMAAAASDEAHLPGRSPLLHTQIHAHPDRYDEILADHLPRLIDALDGPPQWWFSRHRAMPRPGADQYLALTLCLPEPGAYSPAAQQVHDWADHLRRQRLVSQLTLATYEPQYGRYGHGPAMDAAQVAFAADSTAALAQIRMTTTLGTVPPQALAAASLVDLASRFAPSPEQGLRWLVGHLPRQHGPLDRTLRDHARQLADPDGPGASLRSLPGGQDVAAAWQARAAALTAYRERLAAQRDPLTVLHSLLHLHHVRALGVDADLERITGRLARACALRHTTQEPP